MVERGSHRQRSSARTRALLGTAVAALVAVLAGCSDSDGSGGDANAACPAPSSAGPAETARMPDGLSFDKIGTVTHVETTEGNLTVQAVTTKALDEVTVLIQDAVTAAGYRPAGMDSEESEAEVFFNSGSQAAGQARVRRGQCAGQWDIELELIDPDAVSSPTASPTST